MFSLTQIVKGVLEKAALKFSADEDNDYTFSIRNGKEKYDCLAASYPADKLIVFTAAWELPKSKAVLTAKIFEVLNSLNFSLTSGNVEFDGEDTVVFRMPCFLPENEEEAAELCLNVFKKFVKMAKRIFLPMRKKLFSFPMVENVSAAEIDDYFSAWHSQLEKKLDWLYSSACSLSGKERAEQILNTELLVKLFDNPEKHWR